VHLAQKTNIRVHHDLSILTIAKFEYIYFKEAKRKGKK
jgi:hypothetical protein